MTPAELFAANFGLAVALSKRYAAAKRLHRHTAEDVFQAGLIGLHVACHRARPAEFHPKQLADYLAHYVKGYMRKELAKLARQYREPGQRVPLHHLRDLPGPRARPLADPPRDWAAVLATFSGPRRELLRLRLEGLTLNQLAAHFEVSKQAIQLRLRFLARRIRKAFPELAPSYADREGRPVAPRRMGPPAPEPVFEHLVRVIEDHPE